MTRRIAFALMLSLLSATPSMIAAAEPATDEARAGMCEEFTGPAYGFCVALCEARQCDLKPASDERCAVLRRGFDRASGGFHPPC